MANRLTSYFDETPCVSLNEARKHLRMDGTTHDDEYITGLTKTVQLYVERETKTAIFHQRRTIKARGVQRIRIAHPPFLQVISVTVDGSATTDYEVHDDCLVPILHLTKDIGSSPIVVVYDCGYEDDVPADLKHAIKLGCATLYENRETFIGGTIVAKLPKEVTNIINNHAVMRL